MERGAEGRGSLSIGSHTIDSGSHPPPSTKSPHMKDPLRGGTRDAVDQETNDSIEIKSADVPSVTVHYYSDRTFVDPRVYQNRCVLFDVIHLLFGCLLSS